MQSTAITPPGVVYVAVPLAAGAVVVVVGTGWVGALVVGGDNGVVVVVAEPKRGPIGTTGVPPARVVGGMVRVGPPGPAGTDRGGTVGTETPVGTVVVVLVDPA